MPSSAEELLLKITGDATGGQKAVDDILKGVDKTVKAMSGSGLLGSANNVAIAIDKLGGVTKLTADEQTRASLTIDKAIEKYRALGQTAPAAITDLATALKNAKQPAEQLTGKIEKIADEAKTSTGRFDSMKGALSGLTGALGIGFSVGAVVGFGKALLDDADALMKLHDKTGITVEGLQRFQVAGDDAGNSIDDITSAIVKMEDKLVSGDQSAAGALSKLGLSFEDLKGLTPENQFIAISDAIRGIQDPSQQVNIAIDLFGKQGANVLPTLKRGFDDLKGSAVGMSADTVEALDAVGDAMSRWWRTGKGVTAEAAVSFAHMVQAGFSPATLAAQDFARETAAMDRQLAALTATATAGAPKIAAIGPPGLPKDLDNIERALNENVKRAVEWGAKAAEAAKKHKEELDKLGESARVLSFKTFIEDTSRMNAQVPDLSAHMAEMADRFADVRQHMNDLTSSEIEFNRVETETGAILGGTVIPMFSKLATGAAPQMTKALLDATATSAKFGDTLKGNLSKSVGGLNDVFQKAFEGGGGVKGAVQSFATNALSGVLDAIPGIGPVLSQFSGAFVAGFKKLLGGPSAAELEGRKIEAAFEQSFGSFQQMADAIGATYAATGRGAAAAQADIQALMVAEKQGGAATQTVVDRINAVFSEQKKLFNDTNTEFGNLMKAGQDLGVRLPPSLQAAIKPLIEMGKITGDNAALFASLTGSNEVNFKKMQADAEQYGVDLAALGPQFESARLHDSAKNIIDAFDELTQNGANVDGVLAGMKDEIGVLVGDSIKFKTTIPENMRPWIEQLDKTGQLIDGNGDKITDLSGLQFGAPVVSEFQKIVDKLQELIDKIANPLAGAIAGIPSQAAVAAGGMHVAAEQMVSDLGNVEDAVNAVTWGRSPTGLKQIPIALKDIVAGFTDMAKSAGIDLGGVEHDINSVLGYARTVGGLDKIPTLSLLGSQAIRDLSANSTVNLGDLRKELELLLGYGATHGGLQQIPDLAKLAQLGVAKMAQMMGQSIDDVTKSLENATSHITDLILKMGDFSKTKATLGSDKDPNFAGYAALPEIISEADAIKRVNEVFQHFDHRDANAAELAQMRASYGGVAGGNVVKGRLETYLQKLVSTYLQGQLDGIENTAPSAGPAGPPAAATPPSPIAGLLNPSQSGSLEEALAYITSQIGRALSPDELSKAAALVNYTGGSVTGAMVNQILTALAGAAKPMKFGGAGTVTRPTLFLAGVDGNEDYAFSGEGKSWGSRMRGGVTVNLTVQGNVWTERDLADVLSQHIANTFMQSSALPLGAG